MTVGLQKVFNYVCSRRFMQASDKLATAPDARAGTDNPELVGTVTALRTELTKGTSFASPTTARALHQVAKVVALSGDLTNNINSLEGQRAAKQELEAANANFLMTIQVGLQNYLDKMSKVFDFTFAESEA